MVLMTGSLSTAAAVLSERGFYGDRPLKKKKGSKKDADVEEGEVVAGVRMTCQNFLLTLAHACAKRQKKKALVKAQMDGKINEDGATAGGQKAAGGGVSKALVQQSLRAAQKKIGNASIMLVREGAGEPDEIEARAFFVCLVD
mmetsp:Transcript_1208/g.2682  ORF Transcript_1208/g.2682 Transcript_1208/m.2682 type:complete len:143 (-) Transcript_1208:14-442(-)